MWDEEGEALVVQAVHEAIPAGRICSETDGERHKNPVTSHAEPLGASTRNAFDLPLRGRRRRIKSGTHLRPVQPGGSNSVLQKGWQEVLPMLADHNWQLARDLALLALASYAGKGRDRQRIDCQRN